MSVYVSALKPISAGRITKYATMTADTEAELDAMAAVIGGLHDGQRFDAVGSRPASWTLTADQRAAALGNGAKTSTPRTSRRCAFGLIDTDLLNQGVLL